MDRRRGRVGLRWVAVLSAAAFLLTACGGGDKADKGPTRTELIQQADTICKSYGAQLNTIYSSAGHDPTVDQLKVVYSEQLIPKIREEIISLRALTPPDADRVTVEQIFDSLSDGIDQLSATVKDATTVKAINDFVPPALVEANSDAKAYGMTVCGQS